MKGARVSSIILIFRIYYLQGARVSSAIILIFIIYYLQGARVSSAIILIFIIYYLQGARVSSARRGRGFTAGRFGAFVRHIPPLCDISLLCATCRGSCPVFLPMFRLYQVFPLHMCVLPYKYCKIFKMLLKLMTSFDFMCGATF